MLFDTFASCHVFQVIRRPKTHAQENKTPLDGSFQVYLSIFKLRSSQCPSFVGVERAKHAGSESLQGLSKSQKRGARHVRGELALVEPRDVNRASERKQVHENQRESKLRLEIIAQGTIVLQAKRSVSETSSRSSYFDY